MKEEFTNCPQCPNHCPKTNLMCGRGILFFSREEEGKQNHKNKPVEQMNEDEQILHYLRKCGHVLHHNPTLAENTNIFESLSKEEKTLLRETLKKLISNWDKGV